MATAVFIAPGNPLNIVEGLDPTIDREGDDVLTTLRRSDLRKYIAESVVRPGTAVTPKTLAQVANARKKARDLKDTLNGF